LLAASALLSLIIIPVIFRIFNSVFQRQEHFSALGVLKAILITVILPLVIGIAMHHFARALSDRYAVRIGRIGFLLLIVAFLPMLISLLGPMWSLVGNGTIMALIAFALVGVTAGHFLGGQDPADRTVLSLATASRHPAIAVALTSGNMIEAQRKNAAAAIVLYLLVSTIVVGPYLNWLGTYEAEKERLSEA
jgi:BASS family bile acid:Na+ symporter